MDKNQSCRNDLIEAWNRFTDHTCTAEDLTLIWDSLKGDEHLQEFDEVFDRLWNEAYINKPPMTKDRREAYRREADRLIAEYERKRRIQPVRIPSRHIGRFRKAVYVAAAASIAVLLVARIFFMGRNSNDIMNFVTNNTYPVNNSEEIQLMVSEQKTVFLHDKEAVITYDSTSIHTGSEKLSKNSVATYNQLMVPHGKSSVLTLHDGTKIWVNAGTRLVYPVKFEANQREIYVSGEIFLDVSPDAKRPFIVRTNDYRIQVVGTKFNVQAYASDEQSKIALEEGLVKIIDEKNDYVLLQPNQIYELDKSGNSSVKDADIGKYTSWIHGLYLFKDEHLDVILKRLERYYGKEIVAVPSVSEITCSGKLDLKENVDDVLLMICSTASVEYVKEGEKYFISNQPEN
jgi:ferric-dicitrate binding protein FerR (iron transport regulator)